jgi:hypothetical protein
VERRRQRQMCIRDRSNIAGGIVCEEVGVVPIDKATLLAECTRLLQ